MIGNFWCNVSQGLYSLFDTLLNKKSEANYVKKSVGGANAHKNMER